MATRPLRNLQENLTDKIPRGPLGYMGQGNLIGATGLIATSIVRGVIPVDEFGPGYSVEGKSEEQLDDGKVRYTVTINAFSKDVARFVGKRKSAPSNIDFVLSDVEVESVEPKIERSTSTTWEVVTVATKRKPGEGE